MVGKMREGGGLSAERARRASGADSGSSVVSRGWFSMKRKAAAVVRLLSGEDLEALSRELGVTAATLSGWRDAFVSAGQSALKTWPAGCEGWPDRSAAGEDRRDGDGERAALGEDSSDGGGRPFGTREVDEMSRAISTPVGKVYGVARVCRVWERARSTVYHHRGKSQSGRPSRDGAVPRVPAAMRNWLSASDACYPSRPFTGRAMARCGLACATTAHGRPRSGHGG